MKASRLKTIVIVILLLVNAFLLFLLLSRRAEQTQAYERTVEQLCELFERSGVSFDRALLPENSDVYALSPERSSTREMAFAKSLLGDDVSAFDSGGGISRYSSSLGSCSLRSGGTVDAVLSRPLNDAAQFSRELFRSFGYEEVSSSLNGGSGSVTGMRRSKNGPIYNAALTLTFTDSTLTNVSGTFLSDLDEGRRTDGLDAISALVRFLDYCGVSGVVCTEVSTLDSGYLLQSSASAPLRLIPVWRITTDVNNYYVNCKTGEVTRE